MLTPERIKETLTGVKYPGYSRDIVSFGLVQGISVSEGVVKVTIRLSSGSPGVAQEIREQCEKRLEALPGVRAVEVEVLAPASAAAPGPAQGNRMPAIHRLVAVASGKGGVGKSTVSVNLACALHALGAKVGLLDCDIYGPSIPLMMGIHERPSVSAEEKLVPPVRHGVKLMSIGFLIEPETPVIWRGPMIVKTIQQFIHSVDWGTLDFLLVDLPPGTGDAQLTLCQTVPLDGGIIVTTPQEASLGVVRKGISMFQKVQVPILGIVENMSYFTTPQGERVEIFGHGGGRAEADRQGSVFLGEIPIFTAIREGGDVGIPVATGGEASDPARPFFGIARALQKILP